MFSKMLHISCYSLKPGASSATIASRSPYLFNYDVLVKIVAGWKRNIQIQNYSKTTIFFLIGHLGRQVSHLYRTFHFFVGQIDKTDTFQELWITNTARECKVKFIWLTGFDQRRSSTECQKKNQNQNQTRCVINTTNVPACSQSHV
jgi:hypothetical protein